MKYLKMAAKALALGMVFSLATTSSVEAGMFKNLFSRSTRHATMSQQKQKCSPCNQMKTDYRGSGRQPGYRSFYRYNAFFPGYNHTSPYGYDYH